jgi:hypothetical protein
MDTGKIVKGTWFDLKELRKEGILRSAPPRTDEMVATEVVQDQIFINYGSQDPTEQKVITTSLGVINKDKWNKAVQDKVDPVVIYSNIEEFQLKNRQVSFLDNVVHNPPKVVSPPKVNTITEVETKKEENLIGVATVPVNQTHIFTPQKGSEKGSGADPLTKLLQQNAELLNYINSTSKKGVVTETELPVRKENFVIEGLEFLTLEPTSPQTFVHFQIEGFGKITAPYHCVKETNSFMVFVYDTRYESGYRYEPPVSENGFVIKLTMDGREVYLLSLGISFKLGPLDITVMPYHQYKEEKEDTEILPNDPNLLSGE